MRLPVISFRWWIIAIAIVGILPTLVFSGWVLHRYGQSEQQRAERNLIENAKGIARSVDALFVARRSALFALSDSPSLRNGDLATFDARLRRTTAQTGWLFALIDVDGNEEINTGSAKEPAFRTLSGGVLSEVFQHRRPVVTNILQSSPIGKPFAIVAVPVIQNDEVRWAFVSMLTEQDFLPLAANAGVPTSWIVSIVDRTGAHLARSQGSDQYLGKPLVPELLEYLKNKRAATLHSVSLEGIPLISTVQYAPETQWAAAVGLPVATLEAPKRESLHRLIVFGVVVTFVSFGLALLISSILHRSMRHLSDAAQALALGKVVSSPRSVVFEPNEVSSAITDASIELDRLRTGLETDVKQRTIELSEANARLVLEIERRKESEDRLLQMQKMEAIGQLTGGIAHDFNNMLTVILSSLSLTQRRLKRGDVDVQKYIESAVQGADRAAALTARLLAFSRQQTLKPVVVNLNELLQDVEGLLRRTIPESIQIETAMTGRIWLTHVDVAGLESVIVNLAANARDAMPNGGKLTIETANVFLDETYASTNLDVSPGQYVMVALGDTGIGMPEHVVRRAFDPFFTTKPTGQGTGLGLSQVHGFVKQSGGHVAIYTEAGHGTTVKVYLPRYIDGKMVPKEPARDIALPLSRRGEVILVVEDEEAVRKLTVDMVKELGYTVLYAKDASEALSIIDEKPEIALLFTDVVMPGMNGRQLVDEALKRRPKLKALFTTGYTRNAIVHHGILDPGVHLVTKPHSLQSIAAKLSELLDQD